MCIIHFFVCTLLLSPIRESNPAKCLPWWAMWLRYPHGPRKPENK